jgi:hypothetical protein
VKDTETCVGSSLASYFVLFSLISLVSFYFAFISLISFRFVFVDFVSFRFVSFSLISFRFVSFSFYFVSHFIGTSDNTVAKRKKGNWTHNDLQNMYIKLKIE